MKRNPNEMEAAGFTIDRHCYPWLAYKGERFRPTESHVCFTNEEVAQQGTFSLTQADAMALVASVESAEIWSLAYPEGLDMAQRLREHFNFGRADHPRDRPQRS